MSSATVAAPAAASTDVVKNSASQAHGEFVYKKPRFYTFLQRVPGDIVDDWGETFDKKNRIALGLTVAATAALIPEDQHLIDQFQIWGRHAGIAPATAQKQYAPGILGPSNSGSALYFVGDGELHIGLAGGFLLYGAVADDNRALQTSSEIAEAYIASGIVVRVIKYATGRESPYVSTRRGGRWVPFPNPADTFSHANHYDAFPSGHMTSAMAVFTVIAENYGDDYFWIRPVGYAMITGLGFQMMNNGVHWASDYPLALFMGYTFGHIAARKGRTDKNKRSTAQGSWKLAPQMIERNWGLAVSRTF